MFERNLCWIHALSPLHVGSGTGVGFIDLPITREAATGLPYVPGSAIKGVFADSHGADDEGRKINGNVENYLRRLTFGAAGESAANAGESNANAGALVFTDAHLIALPVRSLYGTFAWCSSPFVLRRFRRDLAGVDPPAAQALAVPLGPAGCSDVLVANEKECKLRSEDGRVFFDDLDFRGQGDPNVQAWADGIARSVFHDPEWERLFRERFAVVHDDVFSFLSEHATQVDARVSINPATRTVAVGEGPWYEESLPAESILASIAWFGPLFGRMKDSYEKDHSAEIEKMLGGALAPDAAFRAGLWQHFCGNGPYSLQLGGKSTVGRGQIRMRFSAFTAQSSAGAIR